MKKKIAFQGAKGAYSDLSCHAVFPDYETVPCLGFEEAFAAVRDGTADLAMIPIENSVAGRVADVHHLLPNSELHIIGEHFQPIVHHLLALPGATLSDVKEAHSHVQALAQSRKWLREHNIRAVIAADTAGAAEDVSKRGDKSISAVASELAGKVYGLQSLASDIADRQDNTTRFIILSLEPQKPAPDVPSITTMIFGVRSVPAALYKSLGGFATNGINITKIESYLVDGHFSRAQFRLDIEGHPDTSHFRNAMEELKIFAQNIRILGTYPAHPFRQKT